jgi:hypothetical protein
MKNYCSWLKMVRENQEFDVFLVGRSGKENREILFNICKE